MNWRKLFCAALLASGAAWAQGWEVGVIGGYAYSPKLDVTARSGHASAGLEKGAVVGVYGGQDTYRYFGGEARYLYRFGDAAVSSGGTSASLAAHSQILTGDILGYFRPTGSRIRPFVALGGGVKVINGTGRESATQPLGNFVALTHTREVLAVGDLGFGIKASLSTHVRFRVEAHDYLGQNPHKVLAPAPGASISGVMHDVIGMASIAYTW